jgi:hypothetical protein
MPCQSVAGLFNRACRMPAFCKMAESRNRSLQRVCIVALKPLDLIESMQAFWIFWLPVILLFLTTAIAAIVRNRSRDACLKQFNGCFVLVKTDDDHWFWGELCVFSTCLELRFRDGTDAGDYVKHSYVFYEAEMQAITCLIRPVERDHFEDWQAATRALLRRPLHSRLRRSIRNMFNILRDAFSQSINVLVGFVKTKGRVAAVPAWDQRGAELGRQVLAIVPNAYEPALERYIGREVAAQSIKPGLLKEHASVLQEYTDKFLLLRDTPLAFAPPAEAQEFCGSGFFDAIYSRRIAVIRHRVERKSGREIE